MQEKERDAHWNISSWVQNPTLDAVHVIHKQVIHKSIGFGLTASIKAITHLYLVGLHFFLPLSQAVTSNLLILNINYLQWSRELESRQSLNPAQLDKVSQPCFGSRKIHKIRYSHYSSVNRTIQNIQYIHNVQLQIWKNFRKALHVKHNTKNMSYTHTLILYWILR